MDGSGERLFRCAFPAAPAHESLHPQLVILNRHGTFDPEAEQGIRFILFDREQDELVLEGVRCFVEKCLRGGEVRIVEEGEVGKVDCPPVVDRIEGLDHAGDCYWT